LSWTSSFLISTLILSLKSIGFLMVCSRRHFNAFGHLKSGTALSGGTPHSLSSWLSSLSASSYPSCSFHDVFSYSTPSGSTVST
jgi:hypothetical protein